ncbi:VapE domain-containing protein [Tolypothrix sp. NIES-4075]|uniref:VapE domain-containing protein n=1 Tax=Tolypothrix sp. NIES-4075 TaxID=2005459 RepID=UPI000B5C4F0C|nr:VapE domain-containing protein [Tolypothrix sp. NIES-4075]
MTAFLFNRNQSKTVSYQTVKKKVARATSVVYLTKKMHNLIKLDTNNSTTNRPDSIDISHWEEWIKSGVDEKIISLNVQSIHDSQELDKILNRNNKNRRKHSDNLIPAWCVSGINPQSWEKTLEGVQVKSDNPPIINGKPQKYLNSSGYGTSPLFLDLGIPDYWLNTIEDKSIPNIILEGAKKAGAVLSLGYAAISIPGVSTCRKKGRLHKSLQLFCGYGRTFYLAFDNDVMTKKPVQDALLNLARDLSATGSKVMVLEIPPGEAKGADDFIVANGKEAFENLIKTAKTIEEWRDKVKEFWLLEQERIKETKKSKLARYTHIINLGWGDMLRFNSLKNQIEMNGEPLDLEQVRLRLALEFDVDVPAYDAISIIEFLARKQTYHPVQEYLEDVAQQHPEPDLSILDNLATRYLGSSEPLHNIYMRKTLIAAVARIYEPGCQHDAATIFIGKQYAGKSSFWRKLFGREFFSDQLGEATKSEDELAKVHQFWGLEWSEFETVYRKKDVSSLKKFMSASVDAFRLPYARTTKEYPRQSVLVGTSNESEILNDPTGSRRFWIIPILKESIPLELLEQERDKLWSAAYHAYKNGEQWELDRDSRLKQSELNKDFETQDPWQEKISAYIRDKSYVTIEDIFYHLSIEPSRQDMGLTKRVSAILRQLNWSKIRKYLNGCWVRVWEEVKTKVTFLGGSRGSSQDNVSFDASTIDGDSEKTNSINLGGSRGSSQNNVLEDTLLSSESHNTSVAHDTVSNSSELHEDRVMIEAAQDIQENILNSIPLDPPQNPTFISEVKNKGTGFAPSLPAPLKIKFASPLGDVKAIATPLDSKSWEFHLIYPDGTEQREEKISDEPKASKRLKSLAQKWQANLTYRVNHITQNGYQWVEGCKCIDVTRTSRGGANYTFKSPTGEEIYIFENKDFELMQ